MDQVQLNMKASSDDMSAGGGHADFVLKGNRSSALASKGAPCCVPDHQRRGLSRHKS